MLSTRAADGWFAGAPLLHLGVRRRPAGHPAGQSALLFGQGPFTSANNAFASGVGFGPATLIACDIYDGCCDDGGVRAFASHGSYTDIILSIGTDLFSPVGAAQGVGAHFGSTLFVSDFNTKRIHTLTPDGEPGDFGSAFCFGPTFALWDADLLFAPGGSFLLVADRASGAAWRIAPGPASAIRLTAKRPTASSISLTSSATRTCSWPAAETHSRIGEPAAPGSPGVRCSIMPRRGATRLDSVRDRSSGRRTPSGLCQLAAVRRHQTGSA
jgi:hypothetical protein